MATTMQRPHHQATPARWQAAAQRAITNQIQVRQLAGSGAWVATSGSDPDTAYEVDVYAGVPVECDCPAGQGGDPVCQHRAMVALRFGLIADPRDPDDEPDPPIAAVMVIEPCSICQGTGVVYVADCGGFPYPSCRQCGGSGQVETKEGTSALSPDHRCSCNQGKLTMIYDHSGGTVTARIACVGRGGVRSCGYLGPIMSVAEAQVFEDLRFARRQLEAVTTAVA